MPDPVTVNAEDLKTVAQLLSQAKVASTWLTQIPGFDDAFAALARMCRSLEQQAMPPDPFSVFEKMALLDQHTYEAYRSHGFDDDQSFEILRLLILQRCNLTIAAAQSSG